jgi:hypothetical protein
MANENDIKHKSFQEQKDVSKLFFINAIIIIDDE